MTHAALLKRIVDFAEPMHEEDVVGAKRAIDDELAAPVTVRVLLAQKIFLGPANRTGDLRIVVGIRVARVRRNAGQRDQVGNRRCHRDYEALAATSARLPVKCPLPEVTPLYAAISFPRPVGFGRAPKLNFTVFHVSPRLAFRPRLAVGS